MEQLTERFLEQAKDADGSQVLKADLQDGWTEQAKGLLDSLKLGGGAHAGSDMVAQRGLLQRLARANEIARAAGKLAAEEAMTWDVFRWAVIVLLVANLILILILHSGIRGETVSMEHGAGYASQLTTLRADVDGQIAEVKAELAQDLAAMQSELRQAKAGLKRPTPQVRPELQPIPEKMQPIPMPTRSPRR